MKIKTIKQFDYGKLNIPIGTILDVRLLPSKYPLEFNRPYQAIKGQYSGVVVPREACIELSNEKTYTEKEYKELEQKTKELYARSLEFEKQLLEKGGSARVALPFEVFEGFERVKRAWKRYLTEDNYNSLLLNINAFGTTGDALILKKFAATNPSEYVKALANGYKQKSSNLKDEVTEID